MKRNKKSNKNPSGLEGVIDPSNLAKMTKEVGMTTKERPFNSPIPESMSPTENPFQMTRPPEILIPKGRSAMSKQLHIQSKAIRTPPSMAANTVHMMLTNRIHVNKRRLAGKMIATFVQRRFSKFLSEKKFQESVLKVQNFLRSLKAKRKYAERKNTNVKKEVGRVLTSRLESGEKAEKDIDWLFEESEAESTERLAMMEKQVENMLTRGRAVSTPEADFNWLFRESDSDMKVQTIVEAEAFEFNDQWEDNKGNVEEVKAEQDVEWLFRASENDEFRMREEEVEKEGQDLKPLDFNKERVIEEEMEVPQGEVEVEKEEAEEEEEVEEEVEREEAERMGMEMWEKGQRFREKKEEKETEVVEEEEKEEEMVEEEVEEEEEEDEDEEDEEEKEQTEVVEEVNSSSEEELAMEEEYKEAEDLIATEGDDEGGINDEISLSSDEESSTDELTESTAQGGLSMIREESIEDGAATGTGGKSSMMPERISSLEGLSSLETVQEAENDKVKEGIERLSTFSAEEEFPAFEELEKKQESETQKRRLADTQFDSNFDNQFGNLDAPVFESGKAVESSFDAFPQDVAFPSDEGAKMKGKNEISPGGWGGDDAFETAIFPQQSDENVDVAFKADFGGESSFDTPSFEEAQPAGISEAAFEPTAFESSFDQFEEQGFDQDNFEAGKGAASGAAEEDLTTREQWGDDEDFERPDFGNEKFEARRASKHESFEWDDSDVDKQFDTEEFGEERDDFRAAGTTVTVDTTKRVAQPPPSTPTVVEIPPHRHEQSSPSPPSMEEETIANVTDNMTFLSLFKARLKRGFIVRKHGRKGTPQWRVVFTNDECTHLLWRDCTQEELDSAGGEDDGRDSEWDAESSSDERGSARKKQASKRRSIARVFTRYRKPRKISFDDVDSVRTDGGTEVFGQAIKKNNWMGNRQTGHMLVSIILKGNSGPGKKSLDLEVASPAVHDLLRRGVETLSGIAGRGR